ncbi:hypothetical protein FB45DRAFT_867536 [Roridomyces roridus]|uniref:SHSP domain-containing protein n=1 Tax=Roridomyces roridus TaxID=1738132 RepID=A0AAD7BR48_9AGAR|nr:hypothetical protein FB45DRAFT_867536 [Roridomyces roridus]
MSHARKLRMATSSEEHPQRRAARLLIRETIDAIRTGRVRVVDRPNPHSRFRPRMEVYNNPDLPRVMATFELPGCTIHDFKMVVKQGRLMIDGARKPRYTVNHRHPSLLGSGATQDSTEMDVDSTPQHPPTHFPIQEMRYGRFTRVLRLPDGVMPSDIRASMSDGLLTVTWPRSRPSTPSASIEHPTSSVRAEPIPDHTTT